MQTFSTNGRIVKNTVTIITKKNDLRLILVHKKITRADQLTEECKTAKITESYEE